MSISRDFIHACDDEFMIEEAYQHDMADIAEIVGGVAILDTQRRELQSFGLYTEEKDEIFQESVSDAIKAIGQKILDILQAFKDRVAKIIQSFKSAKWTKLDNNQKIREIAKKDPKAADRIRVALSKGDLDLNSFKDMEHFMNECDKFLDDFEKNHPDPKSMRAKWNKIKDQLNDPKSGLSAVAKAIGVVAAAGALYVTYGKIKNFRMDQMIHEQDTLNNRQERNIRRCNSNVDALNRMLQNQNTGDKTYATSQAAILAEMAAVSAEMNGKRTAKLYGLISKITNGFGKAFDNLSRTNKDSIDAISNTLQKQRESAEKSREVQKHLASLDENHRASGHTMHRGFRDATGSVGTYKGGGGKP